MPLTPLAIVDNPIFQICENGMSTIRSTNNFIIRK